MNERIRELWYQAVQPHTGDSWAEQTAFMEKFAELIVRECLAQVARVDDMLEDNPAQTAAVAWVASSIADHFGVES